MWDAEQVGMLYIYEEGRMGNEINQLVAIDHAKTNQGHLKIKGN